MKFCRDVVAAVTNAGGFGVLGAVAHSPQRLQNELTWIEEQTGGKPYGVDLLLPPKYVGAEQGGIDAKQVGRHRRHPVAQLAGRVQHRVSRHVQLPGGERAAGRRVERAVADVDADVVEPRAEHLGGDLAQAGRLPGAEWLYVAVTHSAVTLAAHLSRLIAAELTTGAEAAGHRDAEGSPSWKGLRGGEGDDADRPGGTNARSRLD